MNDTRGQKIEVGQVVDCQMIGMFRGRVIAVNENTIAIPGQPPMPPHIIIDVQFPKFINGPTPDLQTIYIVQDAPKQAEPSSALAS